MAKREGFGGPIIDPKVTNPAALQYAKGLQERRGSPDRYNAPVGGGQNPPIPRLDMPHQDGMTMADQARAAAQPPPGSVGTIFPQNIPTSTGGLQPSPQLSKPPQNILPADVLPESARQDPAFREGQGSMYASAQPHLAYKYGVIRNKQLISPQQLAGGRSGLSDKTVEGLKAVEDFQKTRQQAESGDRAAEADAAAGVAGAAANIAGGPSELSEEDRQKVRRAVDQMDNFDWNTFKQMTMKDLLNNEEQKKIIEARLDALSLDALIVNGYVRQQVPIVVSKFEPVFQSLGGDEELACKRLIIADAKSLDVTDQYLLDKQSFMLLCCGIYSINTTVLPSHRDADGQFDDTKFWVKFNMMIRYPLHMLASLAINFFWFDVRVRKMFVAEKLGNG